MVDVLQNWLNWFHFLFLEVGLLVILIDFDFSVTIPRCYMDVNSLPIECFRLTHDLSGFKSRINRHRLTVGSFLTDFLCASFSCNSMHYSGCSTLHGVNLIAFFFKGKK